MLYHVARVDEAVEADPEPIARCRGGTAIRREDDLLRIGADRDQCAGGRYVAVHEVDSELTARRELITTPGSSVNTATLPEASAWMSMRPPSTPLPLRHGRTEARCLWYTINRRDDFVTMTDPVHTLYRPVGPNELALIVESGYREFPPRLPEQPIFYPVTNEEYARHIAERWNVKESGFGYVTRFAVREKFIARYRVQQVGARLHTEHWIPAEELSELNRNIVGLIEVIASFERT